MGNSYDNITVYGPTRDDIVALLNQRGHRAWVAPTTNGFTVVFDEDKLAALRNSDGLDLASVTSRAEKAALEEALSAVPRDLATQLNGVVLALGVFDDDVLWYSLRQGEAEVDSYQSTGIFEGEEEHEARLEAWYESEASADPEAELPEKFDIEAAHKPIGGDAALLCALLGASHAQEHVRTLLHEEHFTFETHRHQKLVELLGMPQCAVGLDYPDIERGNVPEHRVTADFIRTGPQ